MLNTLFELKNTYLKGTYFLGNLFSRISRFLRIARKMSISRICLKNFFTDFVRKRPNFVDLILFLAFFLKIFGKKPVKALFRRIYFRGFYTKISALKISKKMQLYNVYYKPIYQSILLQLVRINCFIYSELLIVDG